MKKRFMVTLSVLLLTVMSAFADEKQVVDIYNDLGSFTEIKTAEGFVGRIFLTQGDGHSVVVKGYGEKVKKVTVEVKDGVLVLNLVDVREIKNHDMDKSVAVYVMMKDIRNIHLKGVVNLTANERLNLDKLEMNLEGVCNAACKDVHCDVLSAKLRGVSNLTACVKCNNANVSLEGVCNGTLDVKCDKLDASVRGMGNLTLKGTAVKAEIKKEGIGHINRKGLKVEN